MTLEWAFDVDEALNPPANPAASAVGASAPGPGREAMSASVHGAGTTAVVLGPGAGGTRRTPFLLRVAAALADSGRVAVPFNFPYSEAGRRRPDPGPRLERAVAAVAAQVRERLQPRTLVLGGKSMGGRIASQAVAAGLACDGLAFFGYPLHPPGRETQLRDRHLPQIGVPMLFLQGTRDDFARFDLIEGVTSRLGSLSTLVRLEGADHSFGVPKRSGRTPADVEAELLGAFLAWLGRIEARG